MEMKAKSLNNVSQQFRLVGVKSGVYYVKFPFLEIPVEMSKEFYQSMLSNREDKV